MLPPKPPPYTHPRSHGAWRWETACGFRGFRGFRALRALRSSRATSMSMRRVYHTDGV